MRQHHGYKEGSNSTTYTQGCEDNDEMSNGHHSVPARIQTILKQALWGNAWDDEVHATFQRCLNTWTYLSRC